jgi:hypothetical protein
MTTWILLLRKSGQGKGQAEPALCAPRRFHLIRSSTRMSFVPLEWQSRFGLMCHASRSGAGSRPRSHPCILDRCQKSPIRSPPRTLARFPRSLRPHASDLDQRTWPTVRPGHVPDRDATGRCQSAAITTRPCARSVGRSSAWLATSSRGHGQELILAPDDGEWVRMVPVIGHGDVNARTGWVSGHYPAISAGNRPA